MRALGRMIARAACTLALLAPAAAAGQATAAGVSGVKDFLRMAPEDIKWVAEADGSGVERATLFGDPTKPGIYVVQIKFPRGVMSRPHYHGEDRHATVIQGTWYTGTGDRFTPDQTVGLTRGSYMLHPAGEVHYDGAKDEDVIVRIIGYGPSSTVRLHPEEGSFGRSLPK
jgi:quercetin dioxygenase-like cupin family protein